MKPVWNAQQSQVESQKLIAVDLATGKEKSLVDTIGMDESNRNDFFPSPDQKRIVFVERDSTVKEQKLVVSDLSLATRRVLATVKEPSNSFDTPRWSPDGTKIAYNLMTQVGGALRTELRIVSVDGTWERKIETGKSVGNWTPASWTPDGRKLAITLNEETINELWVMENFLSRSTVPLTKNPAQ